MKTARELAHAHIGHCYFGEPGPHVPSAHAAMCDRLTAAIEARDAEWNRRTPAAPPEPHAGNGRCTYSVELTGGGLVQCSGPSGHSGQHCQRWASPAATPGTAPKETVYPTCHSCGHSSTLHRQDRTCDICGTRCWQRAGTP